MTTDTAHPLQQLMAWLRTSSSTLQLDRTTVRRPQPGVVTARTTNGDLLRLELTIYPRSSR